MGRGTCSETTSPSARNLRRVGDGPTRVDEHGEEGVQACLLMQAGEADTYTTAVTIRDNMTVHGSGQVIEIVLDTISIIVCNHTRMDLHEITKG
jgi:hypothetical protein